MIYCNDCKYIKHFMIWDRKNPHFPRYMKHELAQKALSEGKGGKG